MPKIAVIYYSSSGHVHALAKQVAAGAEETGADVRLRRVAELAPEEVIRGQDAWNEHYVWSKDNVQEAALDDLDWADGIALGTPTRFGLPASQLKQFIDTAGGLWGAGKLADKAATSFTSAQTGHGGHESTILAVNNVFYHWGAVIVGPGYTDPLLFASGGNPYGTSLATGEDAADLIPDVTKAAAHYQGKRLAQMAAKLAA